MFTNMTDRNDVVNNIDESIVLVLNNKKISDLNLHDLLQRIESQSEPLSLKVLYFDFIIGDLETMNKIFERLGQTLTNSKLRDIRRSTPISLFLAGAYLEEQINIFSLNALAIGYDVYLLNDVTIPRDTTHRETFVGRLTQAGVVMMTVPQMLYQWLVVETDQNRIDTLRKLLDYTNSN